jgi:hypothetical protein
MSGNWEIQVHFFFYDGFAVQSSALHCQIANLLSQLECRDAEKRELEASIALGQHQNQRVLEERERQWGEQEAGLVLDKQQMQRMLRDKEKEVESMLALSDQQHRKALNAREKEWEELQASYQGE